MTDFKISYVGDNSVGNVHHIGVDYNRNYYSVIFGQYVNGGFFSIPNWSAGGEISDFDDVFWNAESIGKELKSKKAGKAIATAIVAFANLMENYRVV